MNPYQKFLAFVAPAPKTPGLPAYLRVIVDVVLAEQLAETLYNGLALPLTVKACPSVGANTTGLMLNVTS